MGSLGFTEEYSAILIFTRDARDANISHVDVVSRVLIYFFQKQHSSMRWDKLVGFWPKHAHLRPRHRATTGGAEPSRGLWTPSKKGSPKKSGSGDITAIRSWIEIINDSRSFSVFFGSPKDKSSYRIILVGGLEHFSIIYGIILPNWLIFFRWVETTNQIDLLWLVSLFLYLSHLAMLIPGWNILWRSKSSKSSSCTVPSISDILRVLDGNIMGIIYIDTLW